MPHSLHGSRITVLIWRLVWVVEIWILVAPGAQHGLRRADADGGAVRPLRDAQERSPVSDANYDPNDASKRVTGLARSQLTSFALW
jgi:hypothetical protein